MGGRHGCVWPLSQQRVQHPGVEVWGLEGGDVWAMLDSVYSVH